MTTSKRALRRHQLHMHLKRRLKIYARGKHTVEEYKKIDVWWHVFKTTGRPCSCFLCRAEKYNRNRQKWKNKQLVELQTD